MGAGLSKIFRHRRSGFGVGSSGEQPTIIPKSVSFSPKKQVFSEGQSSPAEESMSESEDDMATLPTSSSTFVPENSPMYPALGVPHQQHKMLKKHSKVDIQVADTNKEIRHGSPAFGPGEKIHMNDLRKSKIKTGWRK